MTSLPRLPPRASLALAAVPLAFAGCGGGTPPGVAPGNDGNLAETTRTLLPYPYPPGAAPSFRWRDVAENPYAPAFRSGSFYEQAQGSVAYGSRAAGLSATLTAAGLKPNFAYQLKLEGQPLGAYPWSAAELRDPRGWGNRQLGQVGRWWCVEDDWNVGDADLPRHVGHTLLGYLLFDFFVTGPDGTATHSFTVDSSYHVLWKTSQRPRAPDDGPGRKHNVAGSSSYGYPGRVVPAEVGLYAEWEPGRAPPGQLSLPPGDYACRLVLTEESFHSAIDDDEGGYWAHALSDEGLTFSVSGGSG